MTVRRENDQGATSYYRSDRFFEEGGSWFFATREGTIEGPFVDKYEAEDQLNKYVKISRLGLISAESGLALAPKD